jgi:hypothetical protein
MFSVSAFRTPQFTILATPSSAPMQTPSPDMPEWMATIFFRPDWPATLHIPQPDPIPEDCEFILDGVDANDNWHWELWRQPDGRRYYLSVVPYTVKRANAPAQPHGLGITPLNVFQFLVGNLIPSVVTLDLADNLPAQLQKIFSTPAPLSSN